MRIAIVTTGRFYVLDLARELAALGHEVQFYSYVSRKRAEQFGLPGKCHRGLPPFVLPLVAAHRWGPKAWGNRLDVLIQKTVDGLVARILEPCDVFIGMSGLCVRSAQTAREKYGAKVILERASRHILSQKEILEAIPGMPRPVIPEFNIERELWGYEFADIVSIPSRQVEESFLERGFPAEKLFRNPFGVDLSMFPRTPRPQNKIPTLVFSGTWCLRKGCDVLTAAIRDRPWRLIHVGSVGDLPLPNLSNFESRGFVQQSDLAKVYSEADLFVHPSREEGLSLVQAQALACGLPLVCTNRTGGEDLREFLDNPSCISVVPPDNVVALKQAIESALSKTMGKHDNSEIGVLSVDRLSWAAYGKRYSAKLSSLYHS